MLTKLLSKYRPPDQAAIGPWTIHWSDDEYLAFGKFSVDSYLDVLRWVIHNGKNYPCTSVAANSSNGYVYLMKNDGTAIRLECVPQ
jgi:hypothetical protein